MLKKEYSPNPSSVKLLGAIVELTKRAEKIKRSFATNPRAVLKLEGGELYFDSVLNLDTDGSVYHTQDAQGQAQTSVENADGSPVDSDSVPYFVLPERNFYRRFGIKLGDVAAVIYRNKMEFAVFADEYGHQHLEEQLGEGSIALHRALGHETISGGKLIDEAIDADVITIVFPASCIEGDAQMPEKIRAVGRKHFLALGGNLPENFS